MDEYFGPSKINGRGTVASLPDELDYSEKRTKREVGSLRPITGRKKWIFEKRKIEGGKKRGINLPIFRQSADIPESGRT